MTWRTGTKNPHTLYLDEGEASIPQGFIMNPGAARAIVEAMNAVEEGRRFWKNVDEGHPAVEQRNQLRAALSDAIDRLNGFLSAYEGAPEPSENDTKQLVARLVTVLQTTEDT